MRVIFNIPMRLLNLRYDPAAADAVTSMLRKHYLFIHDMNVLFNQQSGNEHQLLAYIAEEMANALISDVTITVKEHMASASLTAPARAL